MDPEKKREPGEEPKAAERVELDGVVEFREKKEDQPGVDLDTPVGGPDFWRRVSDSDRYSRG